MLRISEAVQKAFLSLIENGRQEQIIDLIGNQDLPSNLSFFYQLNSAMRKDISFIQIIRNPNIFSDGVHVDEISEDDAIKILNLRETYNNKMQLSREEGDKNSIFNILYEAVANVKFTKKEIYEEFVVTKQTFNKWLKHSFNERFNNNKKITFLEYIEIHEAFLLTKEEGKFNFLEDEKIYEERSKQLVFSKEDIRQKTESNLKTMKKELTKFPLYDNMNVFPFRVANEMIDHLEGKTLKKC